MEVEEGVVNERRERGADDNDNDGELSAADPEEVEFRLREMLGVYEAGEYLNVLKLGV